MIFETIARFARAAPPARLLSVFCIGALLSGCATISQDEETPARAPTEGQVGGIELVLSSGQVGGPKVLVASYAFSEAGVTPRQAIMAFGSAPKPRQAGADYGFHLMDARGNVLARHAIADPRLNVVEQEGLVRAPEAVYAVRFPFDAQAAKIAVVDANGAVLATTVFDGVIREFCAKRKRDPDCQQRQDE